jgi:hypothetical protein
LGHNDCGTKYVITEFDVREVAFKKHNIMKKVVGEDIFCTSLLSVALADSA